MLAFLYIRDCAIDSSPKWFRWVFHCFESKIRAGECLCMRMEHGGLNHSLLLSNQFVSYDDKHITGDVEVSCKRYIFMF